MRRPGPRHGTPWADVACVATPGLLLAAMCYRCFAVHAASKRQRNGKPVARLSDSLHCSRVALLCKGRARRREPGGSGSWQILVRETAKRWRRRRGPASLPIHRLGAHVSWASRQCVGRSLFWTAADGAALCCASHGTVAPTWCPCIWARRPSGTMICATYSCRVPARGGRVVGSRLRAVSRRP